MLSLGLALLAAGFNAVSSVMQRKANLSEARRRRFGLRLLARLPAQPAWLAGLAAMICSFLLQAAALAGGALARVEPVLVLELPLTILLGAWVLHRPLHTRDWLAAAAMAAGLALFIGALSPTGGHAARVSPWLVGGALAATLAGIAVVVGVALAGPERSRAALLGVAAGSGFGLTAAMMKLAVAQLAAGGAAALFTSWTTYLTALLGIASVAVLQAALGAGTLVAVQPGITLLDPLVSVLWGIVVIGEQRRTGPVLALAGAGAIVIAIAAFGLARAAAR